MRVGSAQSVRRLDESVMQKFGVSQTILMEHAALAACNTAETCWGLKDRRVLLVCGRGNNGGDALALARLMHVRGAVVEIVLAANPNSLAGAAAENWTIVQRLPLKTQVLRNSPDSGFLDGVDFLSPDFLVDGLFGTGLSRPVEGLPAELIKRLNTSGRPVLSLDIPSGICADTGAVLGCAVRADATVSFGMLKQGNLLYPGFEHCKVLVIGGSSHYCGAPVLAASAALRSGAGYVRLALPEYLTGRAFGLLPEAVYVPLKCGGSAPGPEHMTELMQQASASSSVVLGPGLSTAKGPAELVLELAAALECPLTVDGDALTALAANHAICRKRRAPTILTPHAAEMARLLGRTTEEINARRLDCALEAAALYNAVVVLKGAHSIIAFPSGKARINLTGNCGMGTAGAGDVLAGRIGALSAQTHAEDAASLAVFIHGLAGDLAAGRLGERGLTAGDILHSVPEAFRLFPEVIRESKFSGKITRV